MSILRKFEPRKRMVDVKQMLSDSRDMDDFFGVTPSRRWMELFEPFGFTSRMDLDHLQSFRLDVIDREKELVVRGELPGIEKDDIEVTVSGDRLVIEAEREFDEEDKDKDNYYRHEVGYGKLMRTIALPAEVDAENVRAELKDGILEVALPKVRATERHTVKVA